MPKCVLIVDDDPVTAEIVRRALQRESGYEVLSAGNGLEALEVLKSRIPDLILLDVQMPKMDGYGFISEKAKVPEYANIPVIVLTSLGTTEPLFQRYGIKAYAPKPVNLKTLLDKISAVISK